jgi:hypothetical protein
LFCWWHVIKDIGDEAKKKINASARIGSPHDFQDTWANLEGMRHWESLDAIKEQWAPKLYAKTFTGGRFTDLAESGISSIKARMTRPGSFVDLYGVLKSTVAGHLLTRAKRLVGGRLVGRRTGFPWQLTNTTRIGSSRVMMQGLAYTLRPGGTKHGIPLHVLKRVCVRLDTESTRYLAVVRRSARGVHPEKTIVFRQGTNPRVDVCEFIGDSLESTDFRCSLCTDNLGEPCAHQWVAFTAMVQKWHSRHAQPSDFSFFEPSFHRRYVMRAGTFIEAREYLTKHSQNTMVTSGAARFEDLVTARVAQVCGDATSSQLRQVVLDCTGEMETRVAAMIRDNAAAAASSRENAAAASVHENAVDEIAAPPPSTPPRSPERQASPVVHSPVRRRPPPGRPSNRRHPSSGEVRGRNQRRRTNTAGSSVSNEA